MSAALIDSTRPLAGQAAAGKWPLALPNGSPWPRLSIVTPSFNQGRYLEETLRSVLAQGYPNLEYLVLDGGSTDGSVEIIRRYAGRLAYWVSEPDGGQFAAINKGFARSTGEIMAWLNSDDMYCPWAFHTVARIFADLPQVQWLTTSTLLGWNERGQIARSVCVPGYTRTGFYRGRHLGNPPGASGWIQQESTFWRRELWEAAGGGLHEGLHYTGDFELWARFWQQADLVTTTCPLGGFRQHRAQKTATLAAYFAEARKILSQYRDRTISNRGLIWLLRQLLKVTGRGGGRFGSRKAWVDYDDDRDRWTYHSEYCI